MPQGASFGAQVKPYPTLLRTFHSSHRRQRQVPTVHPPRGSHPCLPPSGAHGPPHHLPPVLFTYSVGSRPGPLYLLAHPLHLSNAALHPSPWLRAEPLSPQPSLGLPPPSRDCRLKQERSSSPAHSCIASGAEVPIGTGEHWRPGTEATPLPSLSFPIWDGSSPPKAITVP